MRNIEKYAEDENDDTLSIVSSSEFSPSSSLSPLRSFLRSVLLPIVQRESHYVANIQKRFRSPWWDKYFVYTSALGTHTFFIILLPALFFFGFNVEGITNHEMGLGLVMIMGGGVYSTSFIKDLVCSPRPLAPPVTRLTLGNHHLEYGFPSTHSTNSVSIALFFFGYIHTFLDPSQTTVYWLSTVLLALYAFSIVGGRIYTAMHSFVDCIFGVLLGGLVWWSVTDQFGGLGLGRRLHDWVVCAASGLPYPAPNSALNSYTFIDTILSSRVFSYTLSPPLILSSVFLLIINQHPQPIDDCPCFEDAVATGAVVYGALLGSWVTTYFHLDNLVQRVGGPRPQLGSGWQILNNSSISAVTSLASTYNTSSAATTEIWTLLAPQPFIYTTPLFILVSIAKLVLGVAIIFIWRLLAKSVLSVLLPAIFRLVAKGVGFVRWRLGLRWLGMPNRRFYLPATEYTGSVPGLGLGFGAQGRDGGEEEEGDEGMGGQWSRPMSVPSVIDLPSTLKASVEEQGGIGSAPYAYTSPYAALKGGRARGLRRVNGGSDDGTDKRVSQVNDDEGKEEGASARRFRHYDADVLTKVIVYAGMAIISTEFSPLVFELLGWGVHVMPPLDAIVQ
ncbi:hypothetical protein D9757_005966 [Collybiopsis confluens]|uniref:Phosphatidic acid phosphatase type 2/haloperoxidase domain-containing protein n=1 Tax=Collybiopsis confluens TaxID=2823264 RepID=A0A8H5MDB4_9AGAR|nr:hypothetical protein D9757_005966 [Collybiopsis confluens]